MSAEKIFSLTSAIQNAPDAVNAAQQLVDWLDTNLGSAYLKLPQHIITAHNREPNPDFVDWVSQSGNWQHLDQVEITPEGLFVPVILKGQTRGILALDSTSAEAAQVMPLVTLVAQRLETQHNVERSQAVRQLVERINRTIQTDDLLTIIVRDIAQIFDAAGAAVFQFLPDDTQGQVLAAQPVADVIGDSLGASDYMQFAEAFIQHPLQIVNRERAAGFSADLLAIMTRHDYQQLWAVPLMQQGNIIGALGLGITQTEQTRPLPSQDSDLLHLIAGVTAHVMTQHVTEARSQHIKRIIGAAAISQAIINNHEPNALLREVLSLICLRLGHDSAMILGLNQSRSTLTCLMRYDTILGADNLMRGLQIALTDDSVSRQVIFSGENAIITNTFQQGHALPITYTPSDGAQIVLLMQTGQEVIGLLVIGSELPKQFDTKDVDLLRDIADQLAIALFNLEIVDQLRDRLTIMHAMSEVGLLVRSAYDLDGLVMRIHDALYRVHPTSTLAFVQTSRNQQHLVEIIFENGERRTVTRSIENDIISQIVRSETPIFWRNAEERAATARYFGVTVDNLPESFMGLPLVAQDQVMGAIYIYADDRSSYDENDLQFMLMLVNSASFALQNMRLLADAQSRVNELETINHISHTLSATFGDEALWAPLIDHLADLFPEAVVTIMLYDALQDRLYLPDTGRAIELPPAPEALARVVITHGIALDFSDLLNADDRLESFGIDPYTLDHDGLRSWVGAPLNNRENNVVGLLALQSGHAGAFSESDTTLLNMVTAQLSLALDNVRLLEAEQNRRQIADSLIDIGRVVTSTLDVATVFERVFEQITRIVPYTRAAILLSVASNAGMITLEINALDGFDEQYLGQSFTQTSQSPLGQVTATKEPLTIASVSTAPDDTWTAQPDWIKAGQPESWMGVPMIMQSEVIGVIAMDRADGTAFTSDDASTIFALARQAAVAIHNARLHTQSERNLAELENRARRLASMHRIALFISSTLSQDDILQQSCALLADLFQIEHVSIVQLQQQDGSGYLAAAHPASDLTGQIVLENKGAAFEALNRIVSGNKPMLITKNDDEGRALIAPYAAGELRTVLIAPLVAQERALGHITLGSTQSDFVFDHETSETFMTITAQIAVAIRNAELFEEALDASRIKSEFLANVSHELRTPLNAIIGYSELLLSGTYGDMVEQQTDRLERVYRSGRQLLMLINDILDLSKIEAGRLKLDFGRVDVALVVRDALGSVQPQAESKGLSLNVEMADELPNVMADQQRLQQVIVNLLSNGIKFTKDGGVTIHLEQVELRDTRFSMLPEELMARGGSGLHVIVQDTGIGIAESDQVLIFDAFAQADGSAVREYEGTGLGLAITQRLVQMHDGHIWVESKLGEGSTFHVLLPSYETHNQQRSAFIQDDGRPIIVIIDSDETTRRLFKTYLNIGDYQVITSQSLADLSEILKTVTPAAVIVDMLLADGRPAALVERLKRMDGLTDTPLLATSIVANGDLLLQAGASLYLKKPITREQLQMSVKQVLTRR